MRWFYALAALCVALFTFLAAEAPEPTATIEIPMRDGVCLPADIYLPSADAHQLPCILIRAPNGRNRHAEEYGFLVQHGYVLVIQSTRNSLETDDAISFPYLTDAWGALQDGYDTVQWLGKSPYTNGKIGTLGISALGISQLLLAPTAPSHLCCQHIGFAAASLYDHCIYPGGQLQKNQVEGWLGRYTKDPAALELVKNRPHFDWFWLQYDSTHVAEKVRVPALLFGGWYDTFLKGTLDAFISRQKNGGAGARGAQKLIVGPWTHYWPTSQMIGDFKVPENAQQPPIDMSPKAWFDFHLKGIENSVAQMPAVTYYVMGPLDGSPSSGNVWRSAEHWPVPAVATSFYLTADKRLVQTDVPQSEGVKGFMYNPAHPVPTIGGRNLFLEAGAKDQRPIESRDDVLVFTTAPLESDLEVTGNLLAKLYVSTDCKDTDIVVRLCDVYPDGKSILVSDGICRLASAEGPLFSANGSKMPLEVDVDLWATSQLFAKGHCIRVSVTSSNYPKADKNLNISALDPSEDKPRVAHNQVHFGGRYPSRILLPIVQNGSQ